MPSEFHGVRHSNLDRTLDARKALVSGHSLLTGMRESLRYSDEKLDHSGGTYANFPEEAPRLEITRTHGCCVKPSRFQRAANAAMTTQSIPMVLFGFRHFSGSKLEGGLETEPLTFNVRGYFPFFPKTNRKKENGLHRRPR